MRKIFIAIGFLIGISQLAFSEGIMFQDGTNRASVVGNNSYRGGQFITSVSSPIFYISTTNAVLTANDDYSRRVFSVNKTSTVISGNPLSVNIEQTNTVGGNNQIGEFNSNTAGARYLNVRNINTAGSSGIRMGPDNTNFNDIISFNRLSSVYPGQIAYSLSGSGGGEGLGIYNGSIIANKTPLFFVHASSYAVGIGTNAPQACLEIHSTSPVTYQNFMEIHSTGTNWSSRTYQETRSSANYQIPLTVNVATGVIHLGADAVLNNVLFDVSTGSLASYSRLFAVYPSSINFGVPTFSNVPKADYVFEPDHKMLSIDEAEIAVAMNKHLPNFPSGDTFNSISDQRKLSKLLEKLEEAYLYIFQLNNRLKMLEGR